MHSKVFLIITIVFFLAIISCSEKMGVMEQEETFTVKAASIPARINVSQTKTYNIAFKVTHPGGIQAITSVSATFFSSNQIDELLSINLYDDGRVNNLNDGDVIAKDGIFTNTFQSDSAIFPLGPIFIKATVIDNQQQQLQTDFISSLSLLNAPPVLVSVSTPDTLPSGSSTVLFSVTVQDSNQIDDISDVRLKLKKQNLTIFTNSLSLINSIAPDTALFGAFIDSSFATERIGDYQLEFQAIDLSGDSSNNLFKSIYLENLPPIISNIELPDTVRRPTLGADTIVVSGRVEDPQSLNDIETVFFDIYRIGGDTTGIELFDDGDLINHRDLNANDGIYTRGLLVTSQSVAAKFYLIFQAKDKVDNYSGTVIDSMIIR
jgi:hypothetical protein